MEITNKLQYMLSICIIYKCIHRDLHYVTMTATLDFHEAAAESALKRIAAENSKAWRRGIKSKTNTLFVVLRLAMTG